jgi:hypothetical protein
VRGEFDRCWPWLESSMEFTGKTHTKEQVWERIASRKAFFWPNPSSALISEIIQHPSGLRSYNGWLAGGNLEEILQRIPVLEEHGRASDCDRAIVTGRRGWLRVFDGYSEGGTRIYKGLRA